MSLTYDLSRVARLEEELLVEGEDGKKRFCPVTDGLIWTTMSVDMGKITTDNAAEFYARYLIYVRMMGMGQEDAFTLSDIVRHVGLETNVSTLTRDEWFEKMTRFISEDMDRKVEEEAEALAGASRR